MFWAKSNGQTDCLLPKWLLKNHCCWCTIEVEARAACQCCSPWSTISLGRWLGVQDHWGGQALWLVAIVIMVLTGCNKAKSQMAVPRGEMFDWNVGPNLTEVCHRSCAVKVGIQAPFRVSPALWSQISILCRKSLICKDTKVSPTEVMILGSGSGSGRAVTLYQVLSYPR